MASAFRLPGAGCLFVHHGTYRRKIRRGDAHIPRWHCSDAHNTWSLLPRSFAARLPGTLDELEAAETEPSLRAASLLLFLALFQHRNPGLIRLHVPK